MKCTKCRTENPKRAKFCIECGKPMEFQCPQCGAETPAEGKFCMECGHNLSLLSEPTPKSLSFDEKLNKIQRYLPSGLTEKILSQRDKIEGERKQVTVMFCDLEGFTPFVDQVGAEEAYDIMDRVYELLIHKVHDYEGTVNEMTGDGIMALFGAPIALEDAPQRAIRSAYAIHREMARFSEKMEHEREGIPPLKMRVGIHTGPVVVGTLGNDLRVEFKAVGDTVNMASRMENLAEPGATYVTEETFKLTEGLFRFESLGEKEIKGKEEPVRTYRVIGPSTMRTRFDVSTERGLTPYVGRERELELLLDGFERAKQGHGQAFSIISEAGVGKSRLCYEFRKATANEDVTFLEGKCLSYSRGVVYHPIIDLFKSNFDIRENDNDHQIKAKVERGLRQLDLDKATTFPYLLELLSVKDTGFDTIPMSPEGKKDRMIETIIRIPLKGSEIRPLIMVIEDIHWIDKSSEEALKYLLESISGSRILLIFTYRPEFVHTWGGRSYHNQLNLNRLSNRESLTIVSHLLGTENIEEDLVKLILEKTEGVPFFIEELVKSFKDLGIIVNDGNKYYLAKDAKDVTIPSTIQDIIMARIDSLPEGTKEILQTGSVIEREFSHDLIKQVMNISREELLSHLSILKGTELLYERGVYPQSTYVFKHALTRDVVYNSILNRRKKEFHKRIGLAIEETHQDNLGEVCEGLAEHFEKCEDFQRAATYFKMAGAKATNSGAMTESVDYARKTVRCLERLPETEEVLTKIVDIRTILGIRLMDMNYFHQSKEVISPVIEAATRMGRSRRIAQIHTILGSYHYCVREDFTRAFDHLYRSVEIARDLDDNNLLAMGHYWLGWPLAFSCDFESALEHLNQALDIHVQDGNPIWASIIMALTGNIAYHYWGRQESAYEYSNKAVALADESGDVYSKLLAYSCHGVSCWGKGDMDDALEYLSAGLVVAEQVDQFYWQPGNHQFLGDTYYELAEYQESIDHYREAIVNLERSGNLPSWRNIIELTLIRTGLAAGERPDFDHGALAEYSTANKLCVYDGLIKRRIGEIMTYLDRLEEAEHWLERAVETHQRNEMRFHLAGDYAFRAEVCKRRGDPTAMREYLTRAIDVFKVSGADGWVEKYEKELASVS
jgi:class 3 adenylate cyclase/tetratricopeptide (TPR) repeat protein